MYQGYKLWSMDGKEDLCYIFMCLELFSILLMVKKKDKNMILRVMKASFWGIPLIIGNIRCLTNTQKFMMEFINFIVNGGHT